jgi:hypothetical protein
LRAKSVGVGALAEDAAGVRGGLSAETAACVLAVSRIAAPPIRRRSRRSGICMLSLLEAGDRSGTDDFGQFTGRP